MRRTIAVLTVLFCLGSGPAWALDEQGRGPSFNFGGGVSFPIGKSADVLDLGGAFTGGIGYFFTPRLGVTAEYLFSWYDVKAKILQGTEFDGDANMQYGVLNAVFNVTPPTGEVGAYVIGGPGLYYRHIRVTEFVGTGTGTWCDPWLFICYPTAVGIENVIGSRSSTDFGLNIGAGVTLRLGPTRLYLEGRYHYIWGPSFNTPSGKKNADGQFLPLILGLRF